MNHSERNFGCLQINESLTLEGGAEFVVLKTIQALKERGINVGGVSAKEILGSPTVKTFILPFIESSHARCGDQAHIDTLIEIMKVYGYDIAHLHNVDNYSLIDELGQRIPVVKSVHDSRQVCPSENRTLPNGSLCTFPVGSECLDCMHDQGFLESEGRERLTITEQGLAVIRHLPMIFVPSTYMKRQLVMNNVREERIKIIPLFTTPLFPQTRKEESDQSRTKCDLLFVGRLIESKGIDNAMALFTRLNGEPILNVVGSRPDYVKPRNVQKEYKAIERVNFLGWIDNSRIDDYFQDAKVCIVPSLAPESFGIVGLEAMRNCKPVVAYDSGGIDEWLEDGVNGFLVPRGNVDMLTDKVQFLLDNPEIAEEMGKRGNQKLFDKFSLDSHIDQKLIQYRSLL